MKLIGKINYYKEQFVFLFDIKDAFYAILLHFFCVFRYNFCGRTGQGISSYPIQQISSVEMIGFFLGWAKGLCYNDTWGVTYVCTHLLGSVTIHLT